MRDTAGAVSRAHFRYLRCALGELDYSAYRDSDNLVARLTLPSMAYPPERRVEVYAQAVRGLTALEPAPEKRLKYLDFIDIYADLSADERLQYAREYPAEAETMSRFAERFRALTRPYRMNRASRQEARNSPQKVVSGPTVLPVPWASPERRQARAALAGSGVKI